MQFKIRFKCVIAVFKEANKLIAPLSSHMSFKIA